MPNFRQATRRKMAIICIQVKLKRTIINGNSIKNLMFLTTLSILAKVITRTIKETPVSAQI